MLFFILLSPAYRIGIHTGVDDRYKKGTRKCLKLLEIVLKLPNDKTF
jgi:hypothetical protein